MQKNTGERREREKIVWSSSELGVAQFYWFSTLLQQDSNVTPLKIHCTSLESVQAIKFQLHFLMSMPSFRSICNAVLLLRVNKFAV